MRAHATKVETGFQAVISKEIRQQISAKEGRLPDAVIACVGGGSNAIGSFYHFIVNVVFSYGAERFISICQEIEIDRLILPDLPFEEKEEFLPLCHR